MAAVVLEVAVVLEIAAPVVAVKSISSISSSSTGIVVAVVVPKGDQHLKLVHGCQLVRALNQLYL
jgi:hypothetical protein